jgi:hypothetical protein
MITFIVRARVLSVKLKLWPAHFSRGLSTRLAFSEHRVERFSFLPQSGASSSRGGCSCPHPSIRWHTSKSSPLDAKRYAFALDTERNGMTNGLVFKIPPVVSTHSKIRISQSHFSAFVNSFSFLSILYMWRYGVTKQTSMTNITENMDTGFLGKASSIQFSFICSCWRRRWLSDCKVIR